ncbi:MAG: hypothetical protein GZ094_22845 [Mariniphaga sp.]|nr:hypothetical protein [Mariniphaga sp.]
MKKVTIQSCLIIVILVSVFENVFAAKRTSSVSLNPQTGLMTKTIQHAVDSCANRGGGVVLFQAGTYLSGGIELKSKVTLQFEKGAILQGSDKYADYKNDAFIFGKDLSDIAIQGEGIIDGVDCINKQGEEGFRGPHCIRLINCKKISLEGFTIKNSANWAINCRYCSNATVDKVSIRGGHDGLHTRFCNNFAVSGCDFRTGDDCFAGNDNRDITVTDCKINTSCNGFRMGCLNFTVKHCKICGPGESIHKIQKRNNMLAAFVHFSPKDENPKLLSGNWIIEDVLVENVDQFYVYNYLEGLWQTGQPATNIQFKNIKANGILAAFNIIGDLGLKFNLKVEDSSFAFRVGADYLGDKFEGVKLNSSALFNAVNFDQVNLRNVSFSKKSKEPILIIKSGNSFVMNQVNINTGENSLPYSVDKVKKFQKKNLKFNVGLNQ